MTHKQRVKATGLYDGFEGYRTPRDQDLKKVLTQGLVALDANVLLNLYRYTGSTRADLFGVFASLGNRLWIPHQALEEFWRNRNNTIRQPKAAGELAIAELESKWETSLKALRTWSNSIALSQEVTTELGNILEKAFIEVTKRVTEVKDRESSKLSLDTNKDPVLDELEPLIRGKIGIPFTTEEYSRLIDVALERISREFPPGYKDKTKDDKRAAGDYLVWEQVLREASKRRTDVLFVTGDVKDDWWRREHGENRGPRLELVQELKERTGYRLYMLRPESLLLHAKALLSMEISADSVADVNRVDRYLSREHDEDWSGEDQDDLLPDPDERYLLDKLPDGRVGNYLEILIDMARLVQVSPDLDEYLDAFQARFPSITLRSVARRRMKVLVSLGMAHIQNGRVKLTPLGERIIEEESLDLLQASFLRRIAGAREIAELAMSKNPADVRAHLRQEPPVGLSVTQALLVLRWLEQLEMIHAN